MYRALGLIVLLAPSIAPAQIYVAQRSAVSTPTAEQLSALAQWADTVWPDITPARVRRVKCRRAVINGATGANCFAVERLTATAAQIDAYETADRVVTLPEANTITPTGTYGTLRIRHGPSFVSGGLASSLAALATDVWGYPSGQLFELDVWYDEDNDPPRYRMRATRRLGLTAAQRLLCLRAGTCDRRVQ